MAKGRPKKPAAALRLHGSMERNKTRYKDRESDPEPAGTPTPTENLTGRAQKFWDRVVPQLVKLRLAAEIDSDELTCMAQLYAEFQKHYHSRAKGREAKLNNAYTKFRSIAGRFGMSPSDRVGLGALTVSKKSGVEELFA